MEIGEYIDKYIITEVMHGGMSEVYRVAIEGAPIRFVLKRLKKMLMMSKGNYSVERCVYCKN